MLSFHTFSLVIGLGPHQDGARLAGASGLEFGGPVARDARSTRRRTVRVRGSGVPRARRASPCAERKDDHCDGSVCDADVPLPGKRRMGLWENGRTMAVRDGRWTKDDWIAWDE